MGGSNALQVSRATVMEWSQSHTDNAREICPMNQKRKNGRRANTLPDMPVTVCKPYMNRFATPVWCFTVPGLKMRKKRGTKGSNKKRLTPLFRLFPVNQSNITNKANSAWLKPLE